MLQANTRVELHVPKMRFNLLLLHVFLLRTVAMPKMRKPINLDRELIKMAEFVPLRNGLELGTLFGANYLWSIET